MVEYFESSKKPDEDGWFDTNISLSSDPDVYSSLVGVPIQGVTPSPYIDHNMNLQTMYLNVTCKKEKHDDGEYYFPEKGPDLHWALGEHNAVRLWWRDTASGKNSSFVDEYRHRMATQNGSLDAFFFGYDASGSGVPYLTAACFLRTTYVEVNVTCSTSVECRVAKIRRSRLPHPNINITQLDGQSGGDDNPSAAGLSNWYMFATSFVSSVRSRTSTPSLMDGFIARPENPIIAYDATDLERPAEMYSIRFGQLINTYWTLTCTPFLASRTFRNDTPPFDRSRTLTQFDFNAKSETWDVEGTHAVSIEVIQAHKAWIITLAAISIVLIIASLVPVIIRTFLTKGPDIMMNVSSLATRNNPFLPLPPTGTFLDASERAKLFKNYKVRFGDFDGNADVGFLTVGPLETEDWNVARVKKGRAYE